MKDMYSTFVQTHMGSSAQVSSNLSVLERLWSKVHTEPLSKEGTRKSKDYNIDTGHT